MSTLDSRIRLRLSHQREETRPDSLAGVLRRALFAILITFIVLLVPPASRAQITADALVNMDNLSPAAPGTQLNSTILNNGTIGGMTWGSSSGTLSAMTVGPHQSACALETSVTVGSSTYTPATNSQSYAFNNSANFSWWTLSLGGQRKISMGACITTPAANPSNVMDLWEMQDSAGHFVIIQLIQNYCFRIETDGNGTLTSGCINAQAGTSYWCSLLDDETGGTAQLACFLPNAPFSQVGTTQTLQQKTGNNIITVRIGNSEAGTTAGTTYFENLIVDGTQAKFPLGVGTSSGGPPPAPVITSGLSASGNAGSAFSYQIAASNSPTSFNATGLPAGLSVNTTNGQISGTPTSAGSSSVSISASNAGGTGTATLALTINSTPPPPPPPPGQTPWSGIIAPSRAIDWSQAGVVGGIPTRNTQCGLTVAAYSGSAATINNAISACPSGQFVSLGAGTFNLSSGIDFTGHPNVTLRGQGANQTFVVFTGNVGCTLSTGTHVCVGGTDNNWKGGVSNQANWTAGYSQGTTTITLSAVPNLRIGNPIILDQLDDDANGCDSGGVMISMATTTCTGAVSPGIAGPFSLEGNFGGPQRTAGGSRQQEQIVMVAGCNGSTTPGFACSGTNVAVTISPGLYMPNWRASQTPQAWWATSPLTGVGIEDISFDFSADPSGTGIEFKNAMNSWVKGIRSIDTNRAHVQNEYSVHITVRDSYFFLTQNSATQSYGYECFSGSDDLVENNIFHAIAGPVLQNGGCAGDVIGYNFAINMYYTPSPRWNQPTSSLHTAGVAFTLYEGNTFPVVDGDLFHGTHHFVTNFRNRQAGTQPVCYASGATYATAVYASCNNNLIPAQLHSFSRGYNYVGNVLGTTGVQVGYESGSPAIYVIGLGNSNGTVTVPSEPNVATTFMRWGNYDTVTNGGTWNPAEVPSALTGVQAPFSNPVPTSQSLPASFFHLARPYWWPAAKAWPPVGPDVTGGNISGVGGHAYTIPAQDCYASMGGLANGTGPVLTFNANTCYPGSTAALPAPPTGLSAVVH